MCECASVCVACYCELSFALIRLIMLPGTAGGMLTMWVHLVMIVFLSVPPHILDNTMMMGMAVTMVLSGCLIVFVREQYKRSDLDHDDADTASA